MRAAILSIGLLLVPSALLAAASGRVVDVDGKPVKGAEVCNVVKGATADCLPVNEHGYYHLASPAGSSVFVRARGFTPMRVAAVEQSASVVLHRSAALLVKVVDASSHQPVAAGTVTLNYASGLRIGSILPFNRAGVRVGSLVPGDVIAHSEAVGYEPGGPLPITLQEGHEAAVTIEMRKSKPGQLPK